MGDHPSTTPSGRLTRLLDALDRERCAAALLVGPAHAAHLAGYSRLYSGPLALIVGAGGETTLLTPHYEVDAARSLARVDTVLGYGGEGFGLDLAAAERLSEACAELLPAGRRIAVAAEVPGVAETATSTARCEAVEFAPSIAAIRTIKDADECECLARSYELSLAAQSAVGESSAVGVREIDLYTAAFARAQTDAGAPIEFAGDLLVGERTALVCGPVAVPGEHTAGDGDVVVADIVVGHRGYWGDTARTFIVGANDEAERARAFISGVLDDTAAGMVPGASAAEIFAAIAAAIESGYPNGSFPHHGGHGVGVTSFEDPHLIPADRTPLQPGMVISVEPGVYLPGRFGVRVENTYIVTDDGARDLAAVYGAARS
jgi:Xaa-Pro aminopeptidase